MENEKLHVDPAVAASRFFQFVGATVVVVAIVLVIEISHWFWFMFAPGWLFLFFGLWGKNAIEMGTKKNKKLTP